MNTSRFWLKNPVADSLFILSPPFICLLLLLLFPDHFIQQNQIGLSEWVILILCIDVAHVYSTLYKTYWDKTALTKNRQLFLLIPILCWLVAAFTYSLSPKMFWHVIAYIAVFHFVRQQYGFMRLYSRQEQLPVWRKRIDQIAIYSATLGPLLFWHFSAERNFNWFLSGDFFLSESETLSSLVLVVYWTLQILYTGVLLNDSRNRQLNLPKLFLWLGTSLSWYVGIVWLNGDLTFTLFNVVAHGIPYMALIYWQRKPNERNATPWKAVLVFLLPLLAFAFVEEGLWDRLFWHESDHRALFGLFDFIPTLRGHELKALAIATLSLPQLTHYVLDGFIWTRKYQSG